MTTGSKAKFQEEFGKYIKNLNSIFLSPFGREYPKGGERACYLSLILSKNKDIEKVCNVSDFAIIWSEFIKKYNEWWLEKLKNYLEEIK